MSLVGLKKKIVTQSLEKQLKRLVSSNTIPKTIEKIGILADSKLLANYDIVGSFRKVLKNPNEKFIELIIYKSIKDSSGTQHCTLFSEKDFGVLGNIKGADVVSFANEEYDLLINYCDSNCVFANMVALQSNARFKVGFQDEKLQKIYNLSIDVAGGEVDVFNEEMIRYLKIFKLIE